MSKCEFSNKVSETNFTIRGAESNTSGKTANLSFFRTLSTIFIFAGAPFLESDRLFCFIGISKLGSFKNAFVIVFWPP